MTREIFIPYIGKKIYIKAAGYDYFEFKLIDVGEKKLVGHSKEGYTKFIEIGSITKATFSEIKVTNILPASSKG